MSFNKNGAEIMGRANQWETGGFHCDKYLKIRMRDQIHRLIRLVQVHVFRDIARSPCFLLKKLNWLAFMAWVFCLWITYFMNFNGFRLSAAYHQPNTPHHLHKASSFTLHIFPLQPFIIRGNFIVFQVLAPIGYSRISTKTDSIWLDAQHNRIFHWLWGAFHYDHHYYYSFSETIHFGHFSMFYHLATFFFLPSCSQPSFKEPVTQMQVAIHQLRDTDVNSVLYTLMQFCERVFFFFV